MLKSQKYYMIILIIARAVKTTPGKTPVTFKINKYIPNLAVSARTYRCKHLITLGHNPFCFVYFHFVKPWHFDVLIMHLT